jgi:hypothetical protein
MTNKVALGSINFLCIKNSFFIFLMLKMGYFVKHLSKKSFKNGPPQIEIILYHILCIIHHFLHGNSYLDTPQEIDKILPIQQEAGQI